MRIRVVSYNIHKGLAPGNRRSVLGRMRDALSELEPDIVLLQEVVDAHARFAARIPQWSGEPQAQFIARGLRHAAAYGQSAAHSHGGHGNAVLSRFDFAHCANVEMSVNRWEQRGMLHAVVDAGVEVPIHVVCVHLNLLARDRVRQLARMCSFVRRHVPGDEPLILGGDFNDWRGKATGVLTERLWVEEATSPSPASQVPTFPAWWPLLAVDRIYTRNIAVEGAEVLTGRPWQALSDHLPVSAVLSVPGRAATA